MKKLLPFLLLLLSLTSVGQDQCHFFVADSAEMKALELNIQNRTKDDDGQVRKTALVFHVVWNYTGTNERGRVSQEQVSSAVDSANEFFRLQAGTKAEGADMGMEFYLANLDPYGNPTTGIIYHNIDDLDISATDKQEYKDAGISANSSLAASEVAIKSATAWTDPQYYNIWLVTEIDNNGGGFGIVGYAYFPTSSIVDGIVQLSNSTGDVDLGYYDTNGDGAYSSTLTAEGDAKRNLTASRNLNKTLIHELGHTFGLFHTFQGGSCTESNCNIQGDRVCDTPPTSTNSSCGSPACPDAMTSNHMDYTSQNCRVAFTEGQRERARLVSVNSRPDLHDNFALAFEQRLTTIEYEFKAPLTRCDDLVSPSLFVRNTGTENLTTLYIAYGQSFADSVGYRWVGSLMPGQYKEIQLPAVSITGNKIYSLLRRYNGISVEEPIMSVPNTLGADEYVFEMTPDVLGGQNYWEFERSTGQVITSDVYPNFAQGETFRDTICAPSGCYTLNLYDLVGNGICCFNGEGEFNVYKNGDLIWTASEFTDVATWTSCPAEGLISETPESDVTFKVMDRQVQVLPQGTPFKVIDLTGKEVANNNLKDGIYLAVAADRVEKLIVWQR
jgi:predicted Zn-dependent protease